MNTGSPFGALASSQPAAGVQVLFGDSDPLDVEIDVSFFFFLPLFPFRFLPPPPPPLPLSSLPPLPWARIVLMLSSRTWGSSP